MLLCGSIDVGVGRVDALDHGPNHQPHEEEECSTTTHQAIGDQSIQRYVDTRIGTPHELRDERKTRAMAMERTLEPRMDNVSKPQLRPWFGNHVCMDERDRNQNVIRGETKEGNEACGGEKTHKGNLRVHGGKKNKQ